MTTTSIINKDEVLHIGEREDKKEKKPSIDAMAVVYAALLDFYTQGQQSEKLDIQNINHCIEQQRKINAQLEEMHLNSLPSIDALIFQQREYFIKDWKAHIASEYSPEMADKIENYIRTGTMPPEESETEYALMLSIREVWSNRDFGAEARGIMNDAFPHLSMENTLITKERETLNNEITIQQQFSRLCGSYCQTTTSRISQTSSTFTGLLSTQKEVANSIWK